VAGKPEATPQISLKELHHYQQQQAVYRPVSPLAVVGLYLVAGLVYLVLWPLAVWNWIGRKPWRKGC